MASRSYRIGYAFERRVKKFLEKQGHLVWRLPKSGFPDLLAWDPFGGILSAMECKVNKYLSKEEKKMARMLVKKGILFDVAYREDRKLKFWDGNIYE